MYVRMESGTLLACTHRELASLGSGPSSHVGVGARSEGVLLAEGALAPEVVACWRASGACCKYVAVGSESEASAQTRLPQDRMRKITCVPFERSSCRLMGISKQHLPVWRERVRTCEQVLHSVAVHPHEGETCLAWHNRHRSTCGAM